MIPRNLSFFIRIFALLVASLFFIQLVNLALMLLLPPPLDPTFGQGEIKAALIEGKSIKNLDVRTIDQVELRQQDTKLEEIRNRLASRWGISPMDLNVEFAKAPSQHEDRIDKGLFDASRLIPQEAPQSAHVDLETLDFRGDFKIGLRSGSGSWRVASPEDCRLSLWRGRALLSMLATVLLSIPIAYMLASWVSSPIRKFGDAAERLGRNLQAPPLNVDGPREIAGAAMAFNGMRARLSRYVDDRVMMMGAIAHDLRTPLTRLTFHLDKAPNDVRAKAERDISEMREMLAAVLTFVQTMRSDRPRQRQDLRSLIVSIADDQSDMGKDVVVEDGPDVVLVGDNLGLRSLFTNLIENAVTYGGGACIRLRKQGKEAIVEVEDNGPGLPDDELERAFEPFYRSEPSRSRSTGGIGLGLAVVRSVAVAHGGYASLENKVGRGLRARVALPI